MRLVSAIAIVITLAALSACRKKTPTEPRVSAPTPQVAFNLQFEYMQKRDADRLWALYAPSMRTEMGQAREWILKLPEAALKERFNVEKKEIASLKGVAFLRKIFRSAKIPPAGTPVILGIDKQGDNAVIVRYKSDTWQCTQRLVKIGADWRIAEENRCKRPMKKSN